MSRPLKVVEIVNGVPSFAEMADDLDAMQSKVGGYVEMVPLTSGLYLWVNEEGMLHGLPFNALVRTDTGQLPVVGNCFVTRVNRAGDCISVKDADMPIVRKCLGLGELH
jgi:hypothetical protein